LCTYTLYTLYTYTLYTLYTYTLYTLYTYTLYSVRSAATPRHPGAAPSVSNTRRSVALSAAGSSMTHMENRPTADSASSAACRLSPYQFNAKATWVWDLKESDVLRRE
jgi:hypothetical protein